MQVHFQYTNLISTSIEVFAVSSTESESKMATNCLSDRRSQPGMFSSKNCSHISEQTPVFQSWVDFIVTVHGHGGNPTGQFCVGSCIAILFGFYVHSCRFVMVFFGFRIWVTDVSRFGVLNRIAEKC